MCCTRNSTQCRQSSRIKYLYVYTCSQQFFLIHIDSNKLIVLQINIGRSINFSSFIFLYSLIHKRTHKGFKWQTLLFKFSLFLPLSWYSTHKNFNLIVFEFKSRWINLFSTAVIFFLPLILLQSAFFMDRIHCNWFFFLCIGTYILLLFFFVYHREIENKYKHDKWMKRKFLNWLICIHTFEAFF